MIKLTQTKISNKWVDKSIKQTRIMRWPNFDQLNILLIGPGRKPANRNQALVTLDTQAKQRQISLH